MTSYKEGYAQLELDAGFFRQTSIVSRDLSVLIAALQLHDKKLIKKTLHWLDLMSGCGVRSLRWGLETSGTSADKDDLLKRIHLWANDANLDRFNLLKRNLEPLYQRGICIEATSLRAKDLLIKASLNKVFFDLIDLDCFGCPNYLLQYAIDVISFDGIIVLASTSSRSITGHDRKAAIRNFAVSARSHSSSWEIALRIQLGILARKSWMLGRGLEPLIAYSDGRTFRVFVRIRKKFLLEEEQLLGFISKCQFCGAQDSHSLLSLGIKEFCNCKVSKRRWAVNGPLWLGPLQSFKTISRMYSLGKELEIPISKRTDKLIRRLLLDPGEPVFAWSTHELAKRASLQGPPPTKSLIEALHEKGFLAFESALMKGQLRTNASIEDLLILLDTFKVV